MLCLRFPVRFPPCVLVPRQRGYVVLRGRCMDYRTANGREERLVGNAILASLSINAMKGGRDMKYLRKKRVAPTASAAASGG